MAQDNHGTAAGLNCFCIRSIGGFPATLAVEHGLAHALAVGQPGI
jgi:hypothetical protein